MHLIAKLIAIPCFLALLATTAQAQPDIMCKPADFQGRIVDQNGSPVAGAKVLVQNAPYTQDIEWYATQPEEDLLLGEATSDANGRYRIKWRVKSVSAMNNTSAKVDVLVMKPNYAIAFRESSLWWDRYLPFELAPEFEHVGKVLDDQGLPLADAEVRVDNIYNDLLWANRGTVFSMDDDVCSMMISSLRPRTRTDKDGNYRLQGLASGQIVLLQVTHPKFPSIRRMQPVDEKSPKTIQERLNEEDQFGRWYNSYGKPLQMLPGKLVKLVAIEQVTDKPLANLEVCRWFSGESAKCDQDGKLEVWLPEEKPQSRSFGQSRFYARRPGDRFWSPAFLTAAEGDAPAKLMVPPRRLISGYVRDQETQKGLEGIGVYFVNPNEKSWTFTDRNGHYTLSAHGKLSTVKLSGPKRAYDLPVRRWTNQKEEPSREADDALHTRTIRFAIDQLNATADFAIPKLPKLKVRVIDRHGNPLAKTKVQLSPVFTWVQKPSVATTDSTGVAEFEIDRPNIVSTAYVANAQGFGVSTINGTPESPVDLLLEPTIAMGGLLTAKAANGDLRNATGIPIFLNYEDEKSGKTQELEIAVSDQSGSFTIYLPPSDDQEAKLSVKRIHSSSDYDWTVKCDADARASFTMDDDRLP